MPATPCIRRRCRCATRRGEWQTVIEEIGVPVGRPQTIVVDLTDRFLSASREVRIVTSMRVYWDQVEVATATVAATTVRSTGA